jgi:hypothetical protein
VLKGVSDEAKASLGIHGVDDSLGVFGIGGYISGDIESQIVVGLRHPPGVVNLFAHEEKGVPIPALFSFDQDVVISRDDKVQPHALGNASDFLVGGGAIRTGGMKVDAAYIFVEIHGFRLWYGIAWQMVRL